VSISAATGGLDDLRRLAAELLARDQWSAAREATHRSEQLRALLRYAAMCSPYYREVLGGEAEASSARLEDLPTLPKETLMAEFDRIVTDSRLRLDDLEKHLAGANADELYLGEYRLLSTAGTTGVRGVFVYATDEFAFWTAASLRAIARMGVTPATRLVAIGAPSALHLSRQLFAVFQAGRAGVPQLSVLTPIAEMVAALDEYQPEAVIGYPTVISLLAEEQLRGTLRIDPAIVTTGSEVLTETMRARIRNAWGVEPLEVYAATEVPVIASGAPGGRGMRITGDAVVVEVVDELSRPVAPGTPGHKVLVTNLVNRALPLIRYELSDSVTATYERIDRVEGRSDDVVRLEGRDGGIVPVPPFRLRAPFARFPEVLQFQLVHDTEGLHARVVLAGAATREAPERIRAALVAELEGSGAIPPRVDVQPVAELEREPGQGGKLKLVRVAF
jgi:phenylacetate-coenzyme A ligase PaaK-like adenylate-forming protein